MILLSEEKVSLMEEIYTNTRLYKDFVNYKKERNLASREVRYAKKEFEKKLATDIKRNPKSFWKYVRSKTSVKTGVHDLEKEDGTDADVCAQ